MFGIVTDLKEIVSLAIKGIDKYKKKKQLEEMLVLVNDWYDYIDCNLEKGIDPAILDNKDQKVLNYISLELRGYQIRVSMSMIIRWNKMMGIKRELVRDFDIFCKTSRVGFNGVTLDYFFMNLIGSFSSFHSLYKSQNPTGCNFANISMAVRFLNFYVHNK